MFYNKFLYFDILLNQEVQRKKQELLAKEKKRREEMQKKDYERRHKELQERQKVKVI